MAVAALGESSLRPLLQLLQIAHVRAARLLFQRGGPDSLRPRPAIRVHAQAVRRHLAGFVAPVLPKHGRFRCLEAVG